MEFGEIFARRRILVTGATGFVASHLCRALDDLGACLVGLAKSGDWSALPPAIERVEVDLADAEKTAAVVKKLAPDLIFHTAGLVTTRPDPALTLPMIENNLVATAHLLLAARDAGCGRFIHLGTSEEVPPERQSDIPSSPYAVSKQAATQMVRMFAEHFSLPAVVARPCLVYGPRQAADKLIPGAIYSLLRGRSPQLLTPGRRHEFIFVVDVVRGLLAAGSAADAIGRVVALGTGQPLTVAQVVETIADLTAREVPAVAAAGPTREQSGRLMSFADWSPAWSLRDGLNETIRWYRENG